MYVLHAYVCLYVFLARLYDCGLLAADGGVASYILLDIFRLWRDHGEHWQEKSGGYARNSHRMGGGGDGDDLHCRSHLRCTYKPCSHHCFCFLQKVSMERGDFDIDYELFIFWRLFGFKLMFLIFFLTFIWIQTYVLDFDINVSLISLQVPGYVIAQILASILASGTLRLIFSGTHDHFVGNAPIHSNLQSFVMEIIITFYLMFVITAVATDDRAVSAVFLTFS